MKVHPKNKLNDLTAPEWITRTVSVFTQKGLGKGSDEAFYEKQHPAPFSFTDVSRFVEFFTKKDGRVLDPFGGVGSSAKAATLLGRESTSIEINPFFAKLAKERLEKETPKETANLYKVVCGDIRKATEKLPSEHFNLILTSPPYWGILDKIDHKAKQERINNDVLHNYGEINGDISKIKEYDDFIEVLAVIFTNLGSKMKKGGHAVIVVGDFRHKARYYMFHSDLALALEEKGSWCLKGIKIMYQKHKRVFPYGYPYSYVPNLHHQYALILQKTDEK
ncbi:MAG: DNA methyltransferase [Pseudomonadota bacterium]